jgi:hypothetical protein
MRMADTIELFIGNIVGSIGAAIARACFWKPHLK